MYCFSLMIFSERKHSLKLINLVMKTTTLRKFKISAVVVYLVSFDLDSSSKNTIQSHRWVAGFYGKD